jgi:hypothetical protein
VDLRLSGRTVKRYRRTLRSFVATLNKPVEEVTAEDVREWLRPLVDGGANTHGNALKPEGVFQELHEDALGSRELQVQESTLDPCHHSFTRAVAEVLRRAENTDNEGIVPDVRLIGPEEDGIVVLKEGRHRLGKQNDRP